MRRFLLALALALPLQAQSPDLFPRFSITGFAGEANFDTSVRIDPSDDLDAEGTEINLERDLGLPDSQDMQRFALEWRPLHRHELSVNHFGASRDAAQQIDREIVFRDEIYPVSAFVESRFDLDYWSATYTFWARRAERSGIGVTLGAARLGLDASIAATRPGESFSVSETAETEVPVPLAGLQLRGALADRIHARATVAALPRITISGYTGRAVKADAGIEFRPVAWLGVGAAYDYFRLDVDVAEGDLRGDIGMTIQGPGAFIRLAF